MNISTIIFYLSIIGVGVGLRNYKPTFDKTKNAETLQEVLPWFGVLGILSEFRHIIYAGGLGKNMAVFGKDRVNCLNMKHVLLI